ncbi:MAG: 30S ribosomal protein S8 [Pseudomonadota bacterium]
MIFDLTARIQNAYLARHTSFDALYGNFAIAVLKKLQQRKYIKSYEIVNYDKVKKGIHVNLYYKNNFPIIRKINVVSKPSKKVYIKKKDFIKLNHRNNLHMDNLISTSKGLLWLEEAVAKQLGGEIVLTTMLNYKAFQDRR